MTPSRLEELRKIAEQATPGWQLVPKVLTGEWLRKVSFYADNECMYRDQWAQNMWNDVLSAAPSAPSVEREKKS